MFEWFGSIVGIWRAVLAGTNCSSDRPGRNIKISIGRKFFNCTDGYKWIL